MKANSTAVENPAILNWIKRFGWNGTSFLSLYEGYRYFKWEAGKQMGVIAYVDTEMAWVGAGDPVGPETVWPDLLLAFKAAAKGAGKKAILLPASAPAARMVRELGGYALEIGLEPWMKLSSHRTKSDYFKILPLARRVENAGARVENFKASELTLNERREIDDLIEIWLETRRCSTLSFLNRVEPWTFADEKRYFRLMLDGQCMGFLAAVPVPARRAWYLVDLIRLPYAPPGTTELLILEAMEKLRAEGAQEVTLGMSPLAPVDGIEFARRPRIYRLLKFIFDHMGGIYSFKSLYNYKKKFAPDSWEPKYILALQPRFDWRAGSGLFQAVFPRGMRHSAKDSFLKFFGRWKPSAVMGAIFSNKVVLRSPPPDWREALSRMPVTLGLAVLMSLTYFLSKSWPDQFEIFNSNAAIGYSWSRFFAEGWAVANAKNLFFSAFSHGDLGHLTFNLVTLLAFGGLLELAVGHLAMGFSFLIGVALANPVTSMLFLPVLSWLNPGHLEKFVTEVDIGSSLGVFAVVGALLWFIRRPSAIAGILIAGVFAYCWIHGSWLSANHLVALSLGYWLIPRVWLREKV